MKKILKPGQTREYHKEIVKEDSAQFESGMVHPVCSTFALAKAMEWTSRLFILDVIDEDEEGMGTSLQINHHSPALVGEKLLIIATVSSFDNNELHCGLEVKVDDRLVATGTSGQKIMRKSRIKEIFSRLAANGKR